MCLSLCHLSCVPKGHLLVVSGEVLWLIAKLCGGNCIRASTAVCHGDSTCSLCSERKLSENGTPFKIRFFIEIHAFPNHHINLEYHHLHIAQVAKFVEFSGGTLIWWSTCPNAGDYYINRN
jgi:hypothetical protein